MTDELLYFNGIDAETGDYAFKPIDPKTFSDLIVGAPVDMAALNALANQYKLSQTGHWGIVEGHDEDKLDESGWGIVYAHNTSPEIKEALAPLVEWRKAQAAATNELYFKEMVYLPGENKNQFLVRNGYGPGPADPERMPYYLLLVGSPEQIPYDFQTSLDVQYAVGRVCFDSPVEYANYARSVVEAEKQQLRLARRMAFFGVANPDDPATNLSAEHLIAPLIQQLIDKPLPKQAAWDYRSVLKDEATKARLADFIGGPETPALLFSASHGMGFSNGHELQERHQGALLCQDWPGPRAWRGKGRIPEDFYFSGDDIASDANLWGTIAFLFACYGAGTPKLDEFYQHAFKERGEIAKQPFIAKLPQRMLSHPKGGALAAVGHVERAWSYSFVWGQAGRTLGVFETAFKRLMQGKPIGYAFEQFNERHAELSTDLAGALHNAKFFPTDAYEMAGMWTANNDAKNYVILGDPAVRMMVSSEQAAAEPERPSITLSKVPSFKEVKAFESETAIVTTADGNGSGVPAPVDYGVVEDIGGALQGFVGSLGRFLGKAVDNAATLKVRTYTSDDMSAVKMENGQVTGARLRAATALSITGDVDQVVPENEDGSIDMELFQVHLELLKQAEANRAEMIKALISAAASLSNLRGPR